MALETASYIANLVTTNPDGGDARSTADDHLRLIKAALVRTFPKMDSAVSLSAIQVSYVGDLSASVQLQLNALRDGPATSNYALYANSASYAALAATANSASFALLASTANSASYAALAGTANYAASAGFATNATNATNATTANTATNADFATNATFAAEAVFAASCTSASSAALLAGLTGTTAATASTVALRNSSGDLFARYFNASAGTDNNTPSHIFAATSSDGYMRPMTPAYLGAFLSTINITGKTGTTKTLASGSGPPSLTGSTNGDIWYYY